MSRSRRRTPICSITTAASDKAFKVAAHRRARAAVRSVGVTSDTLPAERAFGNPWSAPKDGKRWHGYARPGLLRK